MGEVGCLKDGNFQNLEVANTTILNTGAVTMTGGLNLQEKFTSTGAAIDGGRLIITAPIIRFGPPADTTVASFVAFPAIKQPANTILLNAGFYALEPVAPMSAASNTGMTVGTAAATAATIGGTGADIVVFDPNSLEATNDTASGLIQGACQVVAGDIGMTGVNNAADCAFTATAGIEVVTAERDIHITLISSAHGAASNLNATNIGGNFVAVVDALAPFIVYQSFNTPPGVATGAEKDLFAAALS